MLSDVEMNITLASVIHHRLLIAGMIIREVFWHSEVNINICILLDSKVNPGIKK